MRNDVPTMVCGPSGANALQGQVRWSPAKSIWWFVMALGACAAITHAFSWGGVALFAVTSAATLCLGHSLGMHRRFIHRAWEAPRWLEHLFVYLGTLVGMAGPLGMMRTHDLRDWAQRQPACHDYFGHRRSLLVDAWWQMHCDIALERPPRFVAPAEVAGDRFYRWLERTWMWQQLPWALLFYALGGVGWVLWGVCARVAVSLTGHWFIGHHAHKRGHRSFDMRGAAVQGFNVRVPGLGAVGSWITGAITFGECWHNNHHAYPASSRIGLARHELDPGWWVLLMLHRLGLAGRLALPADLPHRPELRACAAMPDDHGTKYRAHAALTARSEPAAHATSTPAYPLHLLYDSACPVCRSEMHALKSRDDADRLALVDIAAPGFDPAPWGASLAQLNALIHAVDARGVTWRGVPALRAAYGAVGLGAWAAPTGWPLLAPLFDAAYRVFARHRHAFSRIAAPLLDAAVAWRARRALARMATCAAGRCEVAHTDAHTHTSTHSHTSTHAPTPLPAHSASTNTSSPSSTSSIEGGSP